jgi:hypothetical protein
MKILFLHGWHSVPGGVKPTSLIRHGHEVINPALDDDFDNAVRTAQAEYDRHRPDVIVGSSRGGAVAMNIDSGSTPLVLLCPAWKRWSMVTKVKPGTIALHSEADDVVPIADSRELVRASGLPGSAGQADFGTQERCPCQDGERQLFPPVRSTPGLPGPRRLKSRQPFRADADKPTLAWSEGAIGQPSPSSHSRSIPSTPSGIRGALTRWSGASTP